MKPAARIKLAGLMVSKPVKKVFEVLQAEAKEPVVLFVGGCVRNALFGKDISDIDLATKLQPQDVMSRLKGAGIKTIPTGIDHGTVTAVLDGESFQITTLRRDVDTDGRHAKVAYTDDWAEDAARRDFTINTLFADIKGNVFDPLGAGLKDLERRKIVFVGDPETRIREDYLRILRFFRFHAWYGKGAPDKAGLEACNRLSRNLKTLSKERVTQEVSKIILSPNTETVLALMQAYKILPGVINPKHPVSGFKILKKIENVDALALGLLILSGFLKSGTVRIENALRLSNKQKKQIVEVISYLKKFKKITDHDLKVLLYRGGHEIAELVLVSRLILDEAKPAQINKWISVLRKLERPVLPLRGQDLVDQGMQPGPAIKKALEKFERSWIGNGFKVP